MQDGLTALMEACIKGHVEIAEILVKHGAHKGLKDANGRSAMVRFRQDSSPKVFLPLSHGAHFAFPNRTLPRSTTKVRSFTRLGRSSATLAPASSPNGFLARAGGEGKKRNAEKVALRGGTRKYSDAGPALPPPIPLAKIMIRFCVVFNPHFILHLHRHLAAYSHLASRVENMPIYTRRTLFSPAASSRSREFLCVSFLCGRLLRMIAAYAICGHAAGKK